MSISNWIFEVFSLYFRIFVLFLMSRWLLYVESPERLIESLFSVLRHLFEFRLFRSMKVRIDRIGRIIALSIALFPILLERIINIRTGTNSNDGILKRLKIVIEGLADLIRECIVNPVKFTEGLKAKTSEAHNSLSFNTCDFYLIVI